MMRGAVLALAVFLPVAGLAPPVDDSVHRFVQTLSDRNLDPDVRYASALVDLNGDGSPEAVVQIMGPRYCGTGGCGVQVLARHRGSWNVVTDLAIAHPPIRVLNSRTNGGRDLGVVVAGGGVTRAYEARLRFNGHTYPDNPSVPPAIRLRHNLPGRMLIARGDRGRRLF